MPDNKNKQQAAPDFIPASASPDFIPDDGQATYTGELDKRGANAGDTIAAPPPLFSKAGMKQAFWNLTDKGTNLLPTIGGAGGGLVGLPGGPAGSISGAAIGGAGGEALRQLTRRGLGFEAPKTSSDAALQIGGEGLRQGAYEAGGQVTGRVGKVLSPKLAEAAVAPGKRMLKSIPEDVNIGRTVLDESRGVKLPTIVKSLDRNIATASDNVNTLATAAKNRGAKVDLMPARGIASNELGIAAQKNSPSYIRDVGKVNEQLTQQMGANGRPSIALPNAVDPVHARQLKQGLDLEIGNWNPEAQSAIAPLQERVRGSINEGFHIATPGTAELDKRMTAMIPARDAAWNTKFNPGITKSVVERFARPTGALMGMGLGGKEGYDRGGIPGMIAGGIGGLVVPHMVSSPTGLMIEARALENQIPSRALRYTLPVAEGQRKRLGEEEEGADK